jgi:hypothetical protein
MQGQLFRSAFYALDLKPERFDPNKVGTGDLPVLAG